MMIHGHVRVGDEIIHMSVSDVYAGGAATIRKLQKLTDEMQSRKWCPAHKPKGWWWRKYLYLLLDENAQEAE